MKLYWMAPCWGSSAEALPPETQLLLTELQVRPHAAAFWGGGYPPSSRPLFLQNFLLQPPTHTRKNNRRHPHTVPTHRMAATACWRR